MKDWKEIARRLALSGNPVPASWLKMAEEEELAMEAKRGPTPPENKRLNPVVENKAATPRKPRKPKK